MHVPLRGRDVDRPAGARSCDSASQFADDLERVKITSESAISRVLYAAGPAHYMILDLAVKFLIANRQARSFVLC